MKVRGAARTHTGLVRSENQDGFGLVTNMGLGFVADGMGGHAGGKRASKEAARVIMQLVADGATCGVEASLRLLLAIEEANRHLWAIPRTEPALHGLGTTIAALLVDGPVGYIAHVGDSRVYCIRNGAITVLTRDHSRMNDLTTRGVEITDPTLRARYENTLSRAVGVGPTVDVEVTSRALQVGDTFLLCSDGVHRVLSADQLAEIVAAGGEDLNAICAAVITRTNEGGGTDNCTVVLMRIDDDAGVR
jgi:PPM family protein phosphatase